MAVSTRFRVSGATSDRPLMTFETVGTDTPACAAMNAIVVPLPERRFLGAVVDAMAASVAAVRSLRKFRTTPWRPIAPAVSRSDGCAPVARQGD